MSQDFYFKDKFLERLIIPIRDLDGQTVGFTGRILTENPNRPKYLNSPDSDWFKKSNLWFGLDIAKKSIIKHKKVIIVEGNMDVLTAHKHNFPFTVASQGTSFTQTQIQILARLTKVIWLAFDNDTAGKVAAEKFFIIASKFGLQVWQVVIPENFKDLDEYLQFLSQKDEGKTLENDQKDKTDLPKKTKKEEGKEDKFNLKVMPFLDFALQDFDDFDNFNIYEQQEKLHKFLNLTLELEPVILEQTLLKLQTKTKISLNSLKETRSKLGQNSIKITQKDSLDPQIITKLQPKAQKTQNPNLNIAWQNLVSFYVAQKMDLAIVEKMESVFILLQHFLTDLTEFAGFNDYLTQKKDELLLVYDKIKSEELVIVRSKETLQNFFDSQINYIFTSEILTKHYQIILF